MSTVSPSTSTGTGTISSPGVGSGLNVNSIVSQLVAIEKQPLKQLQSQASTLQTQFSEYGNLKSMASNLESAASTLASPHSWAAQTASSSNSMAVAVSVDATATSTAFGVDVTGLAQSQTTAARSLAAGGSLGPGSGTGVLTIQLGSWGAAGAGPFVAGSSAAVTVNVKEGDTYASIAGAINAANAGVTATVLKSGNMERLSLQSKTSGIDAGFSIASNNGFSALNSLSFASQTNGTESASGMESSQVGLNANLKINGVAINSATNIVSNVVPGVTLSLLQTTPAGSPAQIGVSQDQAAVQRNIQAFADVYTALSTELAADTKYVSGGASGILQGDSTTLGIQTMMRKLITSKSVGSTYTSLSQIGLQQQTNGALTLNTSKLTAAMSDMTNLQALFTATNASSSTNGYAVKIRDFASGLNGLTGTVTTKTTALHDALNRNSDEQNTVSDRATRVEAQLRKQYSALDTQMAQLQSLGSYVTAQLATWNKSA